MSSDLGVALMRFAQEKRLSDLMDLAEFCQVMTATALVWTEAEMLPKGETLIRLQHYLLGIGYPVDDLDHVPVPAFKLGQAIAFGVVTVEEAAGVLDYTSPSALYRVIQGAGLSADRLGVLQLLVDQYEAETQARLAHFVSRHAQTPVSSVELSSTADFPSEILARNVGQAIVMLDIALDLVDLNPVTAQSLGERVDTRKINSTVERLLRMI